MGHPGTSQVVPGLLETFETGIFSSHLVGHPGMTLVVPGLLGTFGTGIFSSHLVGHPGTSLVVPGLLGTFGTFWICGTSRDVPSSPRTSWDWDF